MSQPIHILEDPGELLALFNTHDRNPLRCGPVDADWLHAQTLGDPDFIAGDLIGIREGAQLLAAGMAVQRPWKTGRETTGFIKFLISAPGSANSDNVLRPLLGQLQQQLRARGCTQLEYGACAPWYLTPGVPEEDLPLRQALDAEGWTKGSARISLSGNLDTALPQPLPTTPFLIEKVSPDTAPSVSEFIRENFSVSWAREIEPALAPASPAFLCALYGTETRNAVGFACMGATQPGWFGPMGIREDLRGRGLGLALLVHTLCEARAQGQTQAVFPWINDNEAFYRKVFPDAIRHAAWKYMKVMELGGFAHALDI